MVVQAPPPSLLANGVALMRQRKFAAARDVLSPALSDAPPKFSALLPLGYCLLGDAESEAEVARARRDAAAARVWRVPSAPIALQAARVAFAGRDVRAGCPWWKARPGGSES